jgi:hypothetical protein
MVWPDIMTLFPPRFAATAAPQPYGTLCCCPPITWLREAALITRTIDVVWAQLRLPLTITRPAAEDVRAPQRAQMRPG